MTPPTPAERLTPVSQGTESARCSLTLAAGSRVRELWARREQGGPPGNVAFLAHGVHLNSVRTEMSVEKHSPLFLRKWTAVLRA